MKRSSKSTQVVCLFPADPGVRILTNALWSTEGGEHPTQSTQHLWVSFGEPLAIRSLRIHPVPDQVGWASQMTGNRPRKVRIEASRDGGRRFERWAMADLRHWQGEEPVEIPLRKVKTDNLRIVVLDADRKSFPAGPNFARVEVIASNTAGNRQSAIGSRQSFDPAVPSDRVAVRTEAREVSFRTPVLQMAFDANSPRVTHLGWDLFSNTSLATKNLLCSHGPAGAFPCVSSRESSDESRTGEGMMGSGTSDPAGNDARLVSGRDAKVSVGRRRISYTDIRLGEQIRCDLHFDVREQGFDLEVEWRCRHRATALQVAALRIPFDLLSTVTDVFAMPNTTGPLGLVNLPAVIHAPDHGGLRVVAREECGSRLRATTPVFGVVHAHRPRSELWFDLVVGARPLPSGVFELLPGRHRARFELRLTTIFPYCTQPYGDFRPKPVFSVPESDAFRSGLVRGWLNGLAFRPDVGLFANNSVSDAALYCQQFYADIALCTPRLADGLECHELLRFDLEQIFHEAPMWGSDWRTWPTNCASVARSVWCYLAGAQNWAWAEHNRAAIEEWTKRLLAVHSKRDGLMRDVKSGNGESVAGTSWWDGISSGHLEAFNNALSYRALISTSEVMRRMNRPALAARLGDTASRAKRHYRAAFFNPQTGWIAQWRGADGRLRDFGNLAHTGAAIVCGLIEPRDGTRMLKRLLATLRAQGFTRFDLGLPQHLFPVPRAYYAFGFGTPLEPDGSDSRERYMNGAVTTSQSYWFVQALYHCGMRAEANRLLAAMCDGFYRATACGPLHSGVDWKRWDGSPAGYEGLLVDQFHVLLAAITGYLEWQVTLDGLKTTTGSVGDWLMTRTGSKPDFATLAPR